MGLKIFLSHSSKYRDLAIEVKLSLQALEAEDTPDIRFSDDMQPRAAGNQAASPGCGKTRCARLHAPAIPGRHLAPRQAQPDRLRPSSAGRGQW